LHSRCLAKVDNWIRGIQKGVRNAMKRKILVLMLSALMIMTMVATVSAVPAIAQPRCDWYEAGFDRDFGTEWWGYWCRDSYYGDWYLLGWWSSDTGFIYTGG
jgi:hypothetical protein